MRDHRKALLYHTGPGEHRPRTGPCQAWSVRVCGTSYPDKAQSRNGRDSDIHVMLALCCHSHQVVVTNKQLNSADMVDELLRE